MCVEDRWNDKVANEWGASENGELGAHQGQETIMSNGRG